MSLGLLNAIYATERFLTQSGDQSSDLLAMKFNPFKAGVCFLSAVTLAQVTFGHAMYFM